MSSTVWLGPVDNAYLYNDDCYHTAILEQQIATVQEFSARVIDRPGEIHRQALQQLERQKVAKENATRSTACAEHPNIVFKSIKQYTLHVNEMHKGVATCWIDGCGIKCNSTNFSAHRKRNHHTTTALQVCNLCAEKGDFVWSVDATELRSHMNKTHSLSNVVTSKQDGVTYYDSDY